MHKTFVGNNSPCHFTQDSRELPNENQGTANGCGGIGNTLGSVHAHNPHPARQQQSQRHQQYHFAQQGDENGHLSLTERDKHILASPLQAENRHTSQEHGQGMLHGGYQTFVGRKSRRPVRETKS